MRLVAVAAAVATLGFAGSAAAGNKPVRGREPVSPGPGGDARAEAKVHFELAEKLFQQERFAAAEEEYKAAYVAWPLDGFLFNIGQCERNQGHVDEAIGFFERFLQSPKAEAHRAEVETVLAELRAQKAGATGGTTTSPRATPPTPAVPRAAAPAAPAPAAAPSVSVAAVARPATPAAPPAVETPPGATPPPTAPAEEQPIYRRTWFWVAAGAAVVVVAGAVAIGASASPGTPAGSLGTADWR